MAPPKSNRTCSLDGCTRKHCANGLCRMHYQASRRPEADRRVPMATRLMRNRHVTAIGCWEWTSRRDRGGYGKVVVSKGPRSERRSRTLRVHRVAYELYVGPIPDGLVIDHLCRNRACFNPDHLEPVTNHENLLRGAAARTHCLRDHPFDQINTYWLNGQRRCRRCRSAAKARYLARKAQETAVAS